MDLVEKLAALAEVGEVPDARQQRLLQEPVHDLGDARLLERLLGRDVLEAPQVLVEVYLVHPDPAVEIFCDVDEVHN